MAFNTSVVKHLTHILKDLNHVTVQGFHKLAYRNDIDTVDKLKPVLFSSFDNFTLSETIKKRFEQYPDAYIYHYNDYETRALKELASEYSGVFPEGNNLVDFLLRNQKFVDLYRVVEHTLRTSERDLSLKSLEKFYRKEREATIKTAADSIRLYDNWCSTNDDKIRNDIIHYNEEDCVSTYHLREFLVKKNQKPLIGL